SAQTASVALLAPAVLLAQTASRVALIMLPALASTCGRLDRAGSNQPSVVHPATRGIAQLSSPGGGATPVAVPTPATDQPRGQGSPVCAPVCARRQCGGCGRDSRPLLPPRASGSLRVSR